MTKGIFLLQSLPGDLTGFVFLIALILIASRLFRNMKSAFFFFCTCLGLNFLLISFRSVWLQFPEILRTPIFWIDRILLSPFRLILTALHTKSLAPLSLLSISSLFYFALCFMAFKRMRR